MEKRGKKTHDAREPTSPSGLPPSGFRRYAPERLQARQPERNPCSKEHNQSTTSTSPTENPLN